MMLYWLRRKVVYSLQRVISPLFYFIHPFLITTLFSSSVQQLLFSGTYLRQEKSFNMKVKLKEILKVVLSFIQGTKTSFTMFNYV